MAAGWAWRLAVLISVLVVSAGLLFVSGVAGERFGWLTAPVLLGGGGGALAWMLFARHPRRWPVSLAVVAVGFAFGVELWMTTPMMPSRLAVAISSVELPPGTRFLGAQEFGNPVCFSVCPFLVHSYEVPGTRKEVERSLAEAFRSAGWSVDPEEPTVFVAYNEDAAIAAWVRVGDQYAVDQEQQDGREKPRPTYRVEVDVGETAGSRAGRAAWRTTGSGARWRRRG